MTTHYTETKEHAQRVRSWKRCLNCDKMMDKVCMCQIKPPKEHKADSAEIEDAHKFYEQFKVDKGYNFCEGLGDVLELMVRYSLQYNREFTLAKQLLKHAKCPMCDGGGTTPQGDQCQWCDERDSIVKPPEK